jgi:hypothetical protein
MIEYSYKEEKIVPLHFANLNGLQIILFSQKIKKVGLLMCIQRPMAFEFGC